MCSNCRRLRNLLLFIAAVAIFSPNLMLLKLHPLRMAQPAMELTTHFLVYIAACFPVAGMAASYDTLRKQTYRNMCAFCCLHVVATAVALRGLSCLHSAVIPSPQIAGIVEFWAHFIHSVLLRPALWITGGEVDDFPFSEDARVQIWMLCMLCSAVLGLGVGFSLGKTTVGGSSIVEKSALPVAINPWDAFSTNYEARIKSLDLIGGNGGDKQNDVAPAATSSTTPDECLVRKISPVEAGFISACSLSGFWLLLTVIGTFATVAS
jgi:hypothetical protein